MTEIKMIHARQILDSRGNPTVECEITLHTGEVGRGISPSGASTGKLEAIELRDNDKSKFNGKSVYNAVSNINTIIKKMLLEKVLKIKMTLIKLSLILTDLITKKT